MPQHTEVVKGVLQATKTPARTEQTSALLRPDIRPWERQHSLHSESQAARFPFLSALQEEVRSGISSSHWPNSGQTPRIFKLLFQESLQFVITWGFLGSSNGKESVHGVGDLDLIPGSGRSPEGHGNPLQYFCLENPTNRGAWRATVHRVATSWTWLSD